MRRISLKFGLALAVLTLCAELFAQTKPIYVLPEYRQEKTSKKKTGPFLIGTDDGLYRIMSNGMVNSLWTDGKVIKIVKTETNWYFLTNKGIIYSEDLISFTERNNGLPFHIIKEYDGENKKLTNMIAALKDICVDPFDSNIIVTATKDSVFLSRDAGENWISLGSSSKRTVGMKAVAVSHMPVYGELGKIIDKELVVFMSHPIYGFAYYLVDSPKPRWIEVSAGFSALKSFTTPDEIGDILPVLCKDEEGNFYTELYISQTYIPNIYKFNWKQKRAEKIYSGTEAADTIDGLYQSNDSIIFTTLGKISSLSLEDNKIVDLEEYEEIEKKINLPDMVLNCAYIPRKTSGLKTNLELSELWLLNVDKCFSPWGQKANKKKAVYASVYQLQNQKGIDKYRKIVKDNNLNALVFDMKDDYGLLRFEPKSEILKKKGSVTRYKIDVEHVISELKKDNIYLIARIVVFKDKNLASYDKKQYAVWDRVENKPWLGTKGKEEIKDEAGNVVEVKQLYYDEHWVDPYSEEVWEYNIEIGKELIELGFDEIQFDYIRFPTDGENIGRSTYRWRDKGMDKESALISFLKYARENINAPIGIDIYGANGWNRSGTRTGQDVELMSDYVDVICPMFYPSHFNQDFLEYAPFEERPYRIYFYGSYRNAIMGRNRIIVRPWIQAFYMNKRYDRQYYNKDYVMREIYGVRDSIDQGYMHWNNSGKFYEDISPDPLDSEPSPWKNNESDLQKRLPAYSTEDRFNNQFSKKELDHCKDMISIIDTMYYSENELEKFDGISHMLKVEPFGVYQ